MGAGECCIAVVRMQHGERAENPLTAAAGCGIILLEGDKPEFDKEEY